LVLDPRAEATLVDALRSAPIEAAVALAVGPEGGFSVSEHDQLLAAGFVPVRLAPFVLRTELAAVAALAVVAAQQA
jgi:16S rRNA (uracil1498-N3)-methyltransferase